MKSDTSEAVFVLGCGPAGLVAAAAAEEAGRKVTILSKKRRSELWGCQYLHQPIPWFTNIEERVKVQYQLEGDAEGYRAKVYGRDYDGTVSPEDIEEEHSAWDLRMTYLRLWEHFEHKVVDVPILNGQHAQDIMGDFSKTGTVISTIPRPTLCSQRDHRFDEAMIWAMGDSDGQRVPFRPNGDNLVVCNGLRDVGWYRVSQVFGFTTAEWPWREGKRPPFTGVAQVRKPLKTNCTCLPDVHYAGRYGEWRKGALVHEVYQQVLDILSNQQERLF